MNRYLFELDAGYCSITRLFDSPCDLDESCVTHMKIILVALGLAHEDADVSITKGEDEETIVVVDAGMPAVVRLTKFQPGEWITIPEAGAISTVEETDNV